MEKNSQRAFRLKYEIREIKDWPDYFVSENGVVYSCKQTERAFINGGLYRLSPKLRGNGYLEVNLYKKNDKNKTINRSKKVHQLVLEAFKTKPDDGQYWECNHINGDKTDNKITNLEWVTRSQNVMHSYHHLNRPKLIRGVIYDGVKYNSIVECAKALGLNQLSINVALSRGQKTYMGKTIQYAGAKRIGKTEPTNDYYTTKDINGHGLEKIGKGVYKSTKTGNIYKLTDEGLKIDKNETD